MQNPNAGNEITPAQLFTALQKSMAETKEVMERLDAERDQRRKADAELLGTYSKYADLMKSHMDQSKVLLKDMLQRLEPQPVECIVYEYRWLSDTNADEVSKMCSFGWELYRENELLHQGEDEIIHIAKFRRPVTPSTAPDPDKAQKDLSVFEQALGDDDSESEPEPIVEPDDLPRINEDDDGGETAPAIVPEREQEPAPVGYTEIVVSVCYQGGDHLKGEVFADVETLMVPVRMIERDRETGHFKVSLGNDDVLDMRGHDELYRKVDETNSPAAITPAAAIENAIFPAQDGDRVTSSNGVVYKAAPGSPFAYVDREASNKLANEFGQYAAARVVSNG